MGDSITVRTWLTGLQHAAEYHLLTDHLSLFARAHSMGAPGHLCVDDAPAALSDSSVTLSWRPKASHTKSDIGICPTRGSRQGQNVASWGQDACQGASEQICRFVSARLPRLSPTREEKHRQQVANILPTVMLNTEHSPAVVILVNMRIPACNLYTHWPGAAQPEDLRGSERKPWWRITWET